MSAKCKLRKKILKTKDPSPRGLHVHLKSIHKNEDCGCGRSEREVQVISPPSLSPPSSNTGSTNQC